MVKGVNDKTNLPSWRIPFSKRNLATCGFYTFWRCLVASFLLGTFNSDQIPIVFPFAIGGVSIARADSNLPAGSVWASEVETHGKHGVHPSNMKELRFHNMFKYVFCFEVENMTDNQY